MIILIKIVKKIFLILVSFSILIYSLASWRYYGDIQHLRVRIFKSNKSYSNDIYNILWAMSADKNDTNRVEMRAISFYELPSRVLKRGKKHPSHKLINHIINSKEWSKFVPNSKSKTYKTFQTIWISQNLTIRELMNFYLLDIDELSKKHFHKPTDRLNIYEIIKLINIKEGLGEPSDISIKKLKEIFPMKYKNI